jgi:WD40 repeat protein
LYLGRSEWEYCGLAIRGARWSGALSSVFTRRCLRSLYLIRPNHPLVRFWQRRSHLCAIQGRTSDVTSVSFSHDGAHFDSGSADNTIRIWCVKSDKPDNSNTVNNWTMDKNGWIVALNSQLQLWPWAPQDLRTGLKWP